MIGSDELGALIIRVAVVSVEADGSAKIMNPRTVAKAVLAATEPPALLPCPFDGGSAEVRASHDEFSRKMAVVVCRGCGATSAAFTDDVRAISAWNAREASQ